MSEFQTLQLIALIMIAALVFPGYLYYAKTAKKGSTIRNLAIWLAIALAIALVYKIGFDG